MRHAGPRGPLGGGELRRALRNGQAVVVGVIRRGGVIRSGLVVGTAVCLGGSVSALPVEALRTVEVRHPGGFGVQLQARLSGLHVGARAHPGDRGVGSTLAGRRVTVLAHRLLSAVSMESVEAFL